MARQKSIDAIFKNIDKTILRLNNSEPGEQDRFAMLEYKKAMVDMDNATYNACNEIADALLYAVDMFPTLDLLIYKISQLEACMKDNNVEFGEMAYSNKAIISECKDMLERLIEQQYRSRLK